MTKSNDQELQLQFANLRKQFAEVPRQDVVALRAWLQQTQHLGTHSQVRIAQVCARTIQIWKRKCGLTRPGAYKPPINPRGQNTFATIVVPPLKADWDNAEWLAAQYTSGHSIRAIAKAVGCHQVILWRKFKKFNIPCHNSIEASRSRNACCTYDWCYNNYVVLGYPATKCAALAGITRVAFSFWLDRFEIPVRGRLETGRLNTVNNKPVRLWLYTAIHRLKAHPIVQRVRSRASFYMSVRYTTGICEWYNLPESNSTRRRILTERSSRIQHIPPVRLEYETDPLKGCAYPQHYIMHRRDWYTSSLLERRLALHIYIQHLLNQNWDTIDYPWAVLEREWMSLRTVNLNQFYRKGLFHSYSTYHAYARLTQHFGWHGDQAETWSARVYRSALLYLIRMSKKLHTHNVIRCIMHMSSRNPGGVPEAIRYPRMYSPASYACILKKLGVSNSVLDLQPGYGDRAIACAMLGLRYYTIQTPEWQRMLDRGLAELTGLQHAPYAGETVDIVLNDDNHRTSDITSGLAYASHAKRILSFVFAEDHAQMSQQYRPSTVLRIRTKIHPWSAPPNYLYIW